MKILLSVIDSQTGTADAIEMSRIKVFNDKLRQAGQFLFADGLCAPHQAWVCDHRSGQASILPGTLHTETEYLSGFWLLEVESIEQAKAIATEASSCCNRRVELRPCMS